MALSFLCHKKSEVETVVQQYSLKAMFPNQFQPRKVLLSESIQELAAQFKEHGCCQPIMLRVTAPDQTVIMSGERRTRAMQLLGVEKAPAMLQKMEVVVSASMALV